jgi:hypothetical protein
MRAYQLPKSGAGIEAHPEPAYRQVLVKVAACSAEAAIAE